MKYFSPQILDGSVTKVKVADGAVGRAKLDTAIGGQAGSIEGGQKVTVAMNPYSFAVDIATENVQLTLIGDVQVGPLAFPDTPEFGVRNPTGLDYLYAAAWRYVDV